MPKYRGSIELFLFSYIVKYFPQPQYVSLVPSIYSSFCLLYFYFPPSFSFDRGNPFAYSLSFFFKWISLIQNVCLSFLASFQENMYKHWRRKLVSSPKAMCVPLCAQALSHVQLFVTYGLYPTSLLCPRNFPGKNIGAGCHFLLQGIFPTQGSNPYLHLLHWLVSSLALSHLGSPRPKQ